MSLELFQYHSPENTRFVLWGSCLFRVHAQSNDSAMQKVDYHLREEVAPHPGQLKKLGCFAVDIPAYTTLPRANVEYRDYIHESSQPVTVEVEESEKLAGAQLFKINPFLGEVTLMNVFSDNDAHRLRHPADSYDMHAQLKFHEVPGRPLPPHTVTHSR